MEASNLPVFTPLSVTERNAWLAIWHPSTVCMRDTTVSAAHHVCQSASNWLVFRLDTIPVFNLPRWMSAGSLHARRRCFLRIRVFQLSRWIRVCSTDICLICWRTAIIKQYYLLVSACRMLSVCLLLLFHAKGSLVCTLHCKETIPEEMSAF